MFCFCDEPKQCQKSKNAWQSINSLQEWVEITLPKLFKSKRRLVVTNWVSLWLSEKITPDGNRTWMICESWDHLIVWLLAWLVALSCVPSNLITDRRVPKFSLNNCAQSSKKTFMCPKFLTNPVIKYTRCHISTNLSNFLKLCLLYCQKLFVLAPTNCRFAEKNRLSGNTGTEIWTVMLRMLPVRVTTVWAC